MMIMMMDMTTFDDRRRRGQVRRCAALAEGGAAKGVHCFVGGGGDRKNYFYRYRFLRGKKFRRGLFKSWTGTLSNQKNIKRFYDMKTFYNFLLFC
jgi:hypothetical protein